MPAAKVSVKMRPVKTTPGTYLYAVEDGKKQTSPIQNLYIKKSAFGDAAPPAEIEVTVNY